VTIDPDAEQYQIETTCVLDGFVKSPAMQIDIARMQLTIQKIDLICGDVHVIEELSLKPKSMRLRAVRRQSIKLVKKEQNDGGQVESFFAMQSNDFSQSC
jgi:hypothetical protein